jgi:phosphoglycerate dehydrogenase-like enzyme
VLVTIVPGGNANAVAEHSLALMLSLMRRIPVADAELRTGHWPKTKAHLVGTEIAGRVLGVVGAGRIGQKVARLGLGCGMRVIAYDPFPVQAPDGVEMVELDHLIRSADVISLHLPSTPETAAMVNAEWLARMKPTAILVNTSRAGLVDETALVEALDAGTIAGAALDVIEAERPGAPVTIAGRRIDPNWNLVLTPHVGAQTQEAMTKVGLAATDEIVRVLAGQQPNHPVNSISKD